MKIFIAHNNYQIAGGEDQVFADEVNLLKNYHHQVINYTAKNDQLEALNPLKLAGATVWNNQRYQEIRGLLRQEKPQIAHFHNTFPLISPAAYYSAQAEGIPVVQTLHNYRLLCPNALFFRNGQVCEDCLRKFIPWPGVVHSCYRESRTASGATAVMLTLHQTMGTWTQQVDAYIALTQFARQKFVEGGIPEDKIFVKPNFVLPDPETGEGKGGYALFVGRLSVEKGLDTLLTAWEKLNKQIPLKIIGDGPLAAQVKETTQQLEQVEWLGRRPIKEVHDLMGDAMFLIFPSKWYETFGRVAVEAFAKGTPVIAAAHGAIAELVDPGRTGLHFCPNDSEDLASQVEWALSHPEKLIAMRQEARVEFETKYTAEQNYQQLMKIYALVSTRN